MLGISLTNTSYICISFNQRSGSLLATELSLWLVKPLVERRGLCFNSTRLLDPSIPFYLSRKLTNLIVTANITQEESLVDQGHTRWYWEMLRYTNVSFLATKLYHCSLNKSSLLSSICGLALKGLYLKVYYHRLVTRYVDPCVLTNLRYLNSSLPKDLSLWVISSYLGRRFQTKRINIEDVLNLLKSFYAFAVYYKTGYINIIRSIYFSVGRSCNSLEAYSLLLSVTAFGKDWWMYYPIILKRIK